MRGSAPGERRGGRQRGTPNKRTVALETAQAASAAKVTQALGDAAFEGDAHAFLVAVYKDKAQPVELRLHAARAAIPFEKPRLAATELSGPKGGPIEYHDLSELTEDELLALQAIQIKLSSPRPN
jgi:hypothetical protein